jgi:hypothetical protein
MSAVIAGLIGGGVMVPLLHMGIAMMPDKMRMNLFKLLGTMLLLAGGAAYVLGFMIHAMMSVVFGLLHAAFFTWLGVEVGWLWGLIFGSVHWAAVGMALGMMPMMHRGIRNDEVEAPGFFAMKAGGPTAMGFLVLHLVYGILFGVIYAGMAG